MIYIFLQKRPFSLPVYIRKPVSLRQNLSTAELLKTLMHRFYNTVKMIIRASAGCLQTSSAPRCFCSQCRMQAFQTNPENFESLSILHKVKSTLKVEMKDRQSYISGMNGLISFYNRHQKLEDTAFLFLSEVMRFRYLRK